MSCPVSMPAAVLIVPPHYERNVHYVRSAYNYWLNMAGDPFIKTTVFK